MLVQAFKILFNILLQQNDTNQEANNTDENIEADERVPEALYTDDNIEADVQVLQIFIFHIQLL